MENVGEEEENYKKTEYLENKKNLLGQIKSIFHIFNGFL